MARLGGGGEGGEGVGWCWVLAVRCAACHGCRPVLSLSSSFSFNLTLLSLSSLICTPIIHSRTVRSQSALISSNPLPSDPPLSATLPVPALHCTALQALTCPKRPSTASSSSTWCSLRPWCAHSARPVWLMASAGWGACARTRSASSRQRRARMGGIPSICRWGVSWGLQWRNGALSGLPGSTRCVSCAEEGQKQGPVE